MWILRSWEFFLGYGISVTFALLFQEINKYIMHVGLDEHNE